jgi:hypothetical protein
MPSIVDELMYREGQIDEAFAGINQAKAGDLTWDRERGESEASFLARCRQDAALAGYKLISIAGHLPVGSAHGVDWIN